MLKHYLVPLPNIPLFIQIHGKDPEKATGCDTSTWTFVTQTEQQVGVPDSWLWHGHTGNIVALWVMRQLTENLSCFSLLSLSLCVRV